MNRSPSSLALAFCFLTRVTWAEHAEVNAVTAAEDAFGTSIGLQNVGLYTPTDARGFSPQQAGNLRIEGLYFDQQTWVTSSCLVRETAMRIGDCGAVLQLSFVHQYR